MVAPSDSLTIHLAYFPAVIQHVVAKMQCQNSSQPVSHAQSLLQILNRCNKMVGSARPAPSVKTDRSVQTFPWEKSVDNSETQIWKIKGVQARCCRRNSCLSKPSRRADEVNAEEGVRQAIAVIGMPT